MQVYFLFNKITKEFIGFTFDPDSISPNILYRVVTISSDENIRDITWEGDYDTGKMVRSGDSAYTVTEFDLENKFYERFFRKYHLEGAFMTLLDHFTFGEESSEEDKQDFKNLIEFHRKNKNKLKEEIEFFKNSEKHKYVSKEEAAKTSERQFRIE